jgi:hypothetical protein
VLSLSPELRRWFRIDQVEEQLRLLRSQGFIDFNGGLYFGFDLFLEVFIIRLGQDTLIQ